MIGQTISHYRITEKLGEGGMGVVYKAQDTKLERTVALKFLAAHLLKDEESRKRFQREAKAAASLDHPNICTVHAIEESDGRTFIVMAFVKGQSLDKRIEPGPLKIPAALDIAQQIAKGLEAAHEKGVVHRDIKPANVIVDDKGQVTVMDFGLALLTEGSKLTALDATLGTVAYMSPEQAQGAKVDNRTDIWALGCVLYEMVSGRRPFQGEYDQALLYEIVHQEYEPITAVRAAVPMELEFIVGKCLTKDAAQRYQITAELALDLGSLGEKLKSGESATLRSAVADRPPGRDAAFRTQPSVSAHARHAEPRQAGLPTAPQRYLPWALSATLAIALVAVATLFLTQTEESSDRPLIRLQVDLGHDVTPNFGSDVAIAPDGTRLAIAAGAAEDRRLFTRLFSETEFEALDGTRGARAPFFSPDGKWIAFHADGQLKKVASSVESVGKLWFW